MGPAERSFMEGEHLGAVCGLYCGACPVYRVRRDIMPEEQREKKLKKIHESMSARYQLTLDDVHCDGCLAEGGRLTPYCRQCQIRLCAAGREGVTRCSDCADFPCSLITDFNNDGVPHHAEVLDNLHRQRKVGVDEWLQEEYERWRCAFCGVSMDWYSRVCHRCRVPQPDRPSSLLYQYKEYLDELAGLT